MGSRNIRKRSLERRLRGRPPARPPKLRTLLAFVIPLAAVASLAAWMLLEDALEHRRKYGHVHVSMQMLLVALWATGSAVTVLTVWLHASRRARRR